MANSCDRSGDPPTCLRRGLDLGGVVLQQRPVGVVVRRQDAIPLVHVARRPLRRRRWRVTAGEKDGRGRYGDELFHMVSRTVKVPVRNPVHNPDARRKRPMRSMPAVTCSTEAA